MDIETAISVRLKVEAPIPVGYFDGFSKEQTAAFFDVRPETVDSWVRLGMPMQRAGRRPGGQGRWQRSGFNLQACAQWVASNKQGIPTSTETQEADLAYRQEKVKSAELRRRQLEGTLVDAAVYRQRLMEVLAGVRKGVETLHRTYGNDLVDELNRILDEVAQQLFEDSGE